MRYCYQLTHNGQIAQVLDIARSPRYLHEVAMEIKEQAEQVGDISEEQDVEIRFLDHQGSVVILYYDALLKILGEGKGWGKWFSNKPGKLAFFRIGEKEPFMVCHLARTNPKKMLAWEVEFMNEATYGEMGFIHNALLKLNALVLDEDVYQDLVH